MRGKIKKARNMIKSFIIKAISIVFIVFIISVLVAIVWGIGYGISQFGGVFEPQEPITTILGAILVLIGLIYKPLYESLTDQKIELIDYVNMVLAVVFGSVLITFTLSITFGIDKVVKGILALPFLGLGIALLVIAGIFLYIRKQKRTKGD